MKNCIAVWLSIFSIVILIAMIIMAYMFLSHPAKVTPLNLLFSKTTHQHQIVVLDFDDDGLLNETELLQGHDAVIAVNSFKTKNNAEDLFNSISAFQRLDLNKDGLIDKKDPLYPYLELMFFKEDSNNRRCLSFAEAGIKLIKIEQKYLDTPQAISLNPKDNIIGEAVLTNGKRHMIRLINVNIAQ